jgi:hypothetical protein
VLLRQVYALIDIHKSTIITLSREHRHATITFLIRRR